MQSPLNPEAAELIARRFRALSDPTRLRILDYLRNHDEASVGELTEMLGTSQQNVSKHLSALYAEGFVPAASAAPAPSTGSPTPACTKSATASPPASSRNSPS